MKKYNTFNQFSSFIILLLIVASFSANAQNGKRFVLKGASLTDTYIKDSLKIDRVKRLTIAFYNLENLFDTKNDPNKNDEASPIMEYKGDKEEVYKKKVNNMAKVLAEIGTTSVYKSSPAVIGVAEVENRAVLEDVIKNEYLKKKKYGIIHFDSPDWRGIDVALLYRKKYFTPISFKSITLMLKDADGKRIRTRDQLVVTGILDGEQVAFIVNHWPSRRGGEARSRPTREKAAALNVKIIDSLKKEIPEIKIITMGDLNDDPTNTSVKNVLKAVSLKKTQADLKANGDETPYVYNPFNDIGKNEGTLGYRDSYNLFDQIIFTPDFLNKDFSKYQFEKAAIFKPKYMMNKRGRYKGYPKRSWSGGTFTGGYSDHYPTYIYLVKKAE